ncbi:sulfatase [Haliangium ochraceum]|uniref:Sulfatase n=1 Tax=Haliangium ochraceum (strain DSM 14365 / JCM 11303 / SMP-2) TaxID=502025 RepID=D0LG04_HALO1|nr:sulfatase [Haliangium ochraceum]ACY14606.1 sulfatase [Haliangium ochraceum DSM 14365]
MRILYIDIDCLRPDHLGCYGYHRDTSPNIDAIAARGLRFDNVYISDAPCLPSRTALFSGRFGVHTGVVNHGGLGADMYPDGESRGFGSRLGRTCYMRALRDAGFYTATVSPFGERHAAWHFYAGFHEVHNPGRRGLERADEIEPIAQDWLRRRGREDDWFLHVNLWDPHMPYRAPASFGEPFADAPLPAWLSEEVRAAHYEGCGPHSAREVIGFSDQVPPGIAWDYPRQPLRIDSMDAVRRVFDGYDTGVRYADEAVGRLLATLDELGVREDTAIIVSADHGEALGEQNIYGDHQTADHITTRVPWILDWPGVTEAAAGQARSALHYQVDTAATVIELAGGTVPGGWDGRSFADRLSEGADEGRPCLVMSQAAWSCQRAVRLVDDGRDYVFVRSYHDGYHCFDELQLFDIGADYHAQHNLAAERPALVQRALAQLESWHGEMMRTATHPADPMWNVLREGGPKHTRGELPGYLARLRATGRERWAERLEARHGAG